MADTPVNLGPIEAKRLLRTNLRRAREARAITQEQVVEAMEWSLAKLLRVEGGVNAISSTDLAALLSFYDVTDPDQVAQMRAWSRIARRRPWWTQYREAMGTAYATYAGVESEATTVHYFDNGVGPSLLWTEAYARSVLSDSGLVGGLADLHLELIRVRRQQVLTCGNEVRFLLDEAVLRRVVGGAFTHREQLAYLAQTVAANPKLTLRVLPFTAGSWGGVTESQAIFQFQPSDLVVGFTGVPPRITELATGQPNLARMEWLWDMAMSPADSARLIADAG